ncbi:hypothetical protein RRG08_005430 [Elysia crispata]|uniref:Uncharacterized protein n=1 Tax=Elysia crispata TaxID=231223 RepID=A0AAE0Y1B4_9GAST|nr:hypothetical protein RRG08_005430 [Elysia crispata]
MSIIFSLSVSGDTIFILHSVIFSRFAERLTLAVHLLRTLHLDSVPGPSRRTRKKRICQLRRALGPNTRDVTRLYKRGPSFGPGLSSIQSP